MRTDNTNGKKYKKDVDRSNDNKVDMYVKNVSQLTNIPENVANHIMWLIYNSEIHDLAMDCIESNERVSDFSIEIPYIGRMDLSFNKEDENNCIIVRGMEFEDNFKADIKMAIEKGDSPIVKYLKPRLIATLKRRYDQTL